MTTKTILAPMPIRRHRRFEVSCRARIRIKNRHYAGSLENISRGGACISTLNMIGSPGPVTLVLPDMDPVSGTLRWLDGDIAGIIFEQEIAEYDLARWLSTRLTVKTTRILPDEDVHLVRTGAANPTSERLIAGGA